MDDEILKRIDEHMARNSELMEEIREEMRLSRTEHERSRRVHIDLREFIQQQTRRMEVASSAQVEGIRSLSNSMERSMGQMVAAIDDMRDQIRANTEAVLRVLDRFPPGGGTAPA